MHPIPQQHLELNDFNLNKVKRALIFCSVALLLSVFAGAYLVHAVLNLPKEIWTWSQVTTMPVLSAGLAFVCLMAMAKGNHLKAKRLLGQMGAYDHLRQYEPAMTSASSGPATLQQGRPL